MEQKNIENIPEEVRLNIFKFVDKKTLKNVALTCKTWRGLSNQLSWFLHIRFPCFDINDRDSILESERRFVRLKISDCSFDEWESHILLEICTKHGGRVQELCIFNSKINDFKVFIDILKAMPNLKKCIMFNVSVFNDPEGDLPLFEKLETLEMVNSNSRILKCYQKSQLSALKFFGPETLEPAEPFLDFLATQKNLKSLALRSIRRWTSELFKTPLNDIPFKLDKLSLLGFKLRNASNDYNNLLKFLKSHARTLHELEIGKHFPDFIFEYILSKFNQLQSLKISTDSIPKDMTLYDRLEVNMSITKLIILGHPWIFKNNDPFKAFMRCLPNVRSLILIEIQKTEMMQFASTNFLRLRYLKVKTITDAVSFPNLVTLHVQNYYDQNDWAGFTAVNRGIKELIVKTITETGGTAEKLLEGITDIPNLRVLRLGQHIRFNKELFDNIRQNCVDLEVLRLHKETLGEVDVSEVKDIPALTIYEDFEAEFPDKKDGKFWNDDDCDETMPEDGEESDDDSFEDNDDYRRAMMGGPFDFYENYFEF